MITKDEITMYIRSYALFLKEMLMFRYTVAYMNANIHLVMNSFGTLPWQDFPLTFPWLLTTSLTCFKFPDISRFSRQVVTLYIISQDQQTLPHSTSNSNSRDRPHNSELPDCMPYLTTFNFIIKMYFLQNLLSYWLYCFYTLCSFILYNSRLTGVLLKKHLIDLTFISGNKP